MEITGYITRDKVTPLMAMSCSPKAGIKHIYSFLGDEQAWTSINLVHEKRFLDLMTIQERYGQWSYIFIDLFSDQWYSKFIHNY